MSPYKQDGLWYYTELPQGMRPAVNDDFYTSDGQFKMGIDFLIIGSVYKEYEHHKTTTLENFKQYEHFIPVGRMYVKS